MSAKILSTYVKNFQFFPKSSIYDDDAKYRISEFNRHVATLYFIVRTKKVSFLPETFRVGDDYSFHGLVDIAGNQYPIRFSCVDILFSYEGIKQKFRNQKEFVEYCMNKWRDPARPSLTSSQKYAEKAFVDIKKSKTNRLIVECPVKRSITKEQIGEVILSPYHLLNTANTTNLAPLEIIYIGKSNDDTWKRIYNHNKWGLIEEHKEESEDLLVYFLEIDKSSILDHAVNGFHMIARDESELSIEDATVATEAALINYFVKEKKFNDQHVGSDITKSETIIKRVKSRGYTDLVVECDLEGPFGVLGTQSSGFSQRHAVKYKL